MKENSFGIIPLRKNESGEWELFLVQHQAGHFSFPKGHKNRDESDLQAATRELFEETGLKIEKLLFNEPLIERYFFKRDDKTISKTVSFFIALCGGKPRIQEEEIQAGFWLNFQKAKEKATFPQIKHIIDQVKKLLNTL